MKSVVIAIALGLASTADAKGGKKDSGADAFAEAVVTCVAAALAGGQPDPVALAGQCVEATQVIWAAAYPSICGPSGP